LHVNDILSNRCMCCSCYYDCHKYF